MSYFMNCFARLDAREVIYQMPVKSKFQCSDEWPCSEVCISVSKSHVCGPFSWAASHMWPLLHSIKLHYNTVRQDCWTTLSGLDHQTIDVEAPDQDHVMDLRAMTFVHIRDWKMPAGCHHSPHVVDDDTVKPQRGTDPDDVLHKDFSYAKCLLISDITLYSIQIRTAWIRQQ